MTDELHPLEQKESIKLVKNSRGYGWEIKLLEIDLIRLDELNKELIKTYGDPEVTTGQEIKV